MPYVRRLSNLLMLQIFVLTCWSLLYRLCCFYVQLFCILTIFGFFAFGTLVCRLRCPGLFSAYNYLEIVTSRIFTMQGFHLFFLVAFILCLKSFRPFLHRVAATIIDVFVPLVGWLYNRDVCRILRCWNFEIRCCCMDVRLANTVFSCQNCAVVGV